MIKLSGASVRYAGGPWLFRNLDVQIEAGETVVLLGPNGTGKTTLLKIIMGLEALTEGRVECPGRVGHVPQSLNVLFEFSVLDIVVMGAAAASKGLFVTPGPADYQSAEAALIQVDMGEFRDRVFASLSGGERQLVLLARAIASGAGLILLDEPTAALDLANEEKVLAMLERLRSSGITLLMSTHNPEHALRLADRVLLLGRDGNYQFGSVDETLTDRSLSDLYGVPLSRIQIESDQGPLAIIARVQRLENAPGESR